jgi:hypothetical protein
MIGVNRARRRELAKFGILFALSALCVNFAGKGGRLTADFTVFRPAAYPSHPSHLVVENALISGFLPRVQKKVKKSEKTLYMESEKSEKIYSQLLKIAENVFFLKKDKKTLTSFCPFDKVTHTRDKQNTKHTRK